MALSENDTTGREGGGLRPGFLLYFVFFSEVNVQKKKIVAIVTGLPSDMDGVHSVCPEASVTPRQYLQNHSFVPTVPCGRDMAAHGFIPTV